MKKKNYFKKIRIGLMISILSLCSYLSVNAQFKVSSPQSGNLLYPGEIFEFSWGKFNDNTDRYLWEWKFTGIAKQNNSLTTVIISNSGVNEEDSWWGGQKRSAGNFSIPCDWVSGVFDFKVEAQRRNFGFWKSQFTVYSANTLGVKAPKTPSPRALINCDPSIDFEINGNAKNGNVVFWYLSQNGDYFHQGDVLKRKFPEGLSTIYYSYGDPGSDKCENITLRIPIIVYTIPKSNLPNKPFDLGSYVVYPDPDPRLNVPECSVPNTFWKLPNESEIANILNPFRKKINLNNINVTLEPSIYWVAEDGLEPQYEYEANGGLKVCYRNLEQVNKKSRKYLCYLKLNAKIEITEIQVIHKGPLQTALETVVVASDNKTDCAIDQIIAYETISESDLCLPFSSLNFDEESQEKLAKNCLFKEVKLICEESEVEQKIGPPENLYNDTDFHANTSYGDNAQSSTKYTFQWSPIKGLSDPKIKRPIVDWKKMPNDVNTFQLYRCSIKEEIIVRGGTNPETGKVYTENTFTTYFDWCTLAFKCNNCMKGANQKFIFVENPIDTVSNTTIDQKTIMEIKSIPYYLYPNPTKNKIGLRKLNTLSSNNVQYIIYGMDGREVKTGALNNSLLEESIDLEELNSGIYEIVILEDSNKIFHSKIIVMD